MKRTFFAKIISAVLVLAMLLSICIFPVDAEETPADDKFADGTFKVLFIGNSASDDATDSGYQDDSKLYEIMKAMVGDTAKIDIGLCWSGGKTLAWHATVAEAGNGEYTFMYHADGDKWKILSASCSADALKYTDWDAVVLQPWGLEVTKGKATYANNESPDFVELENSVPYMLDHVATHAPNADIYYYHIWATTHDYQNLDAERKNYEAICKYTRLAETYKGTKTGAAFKGVVPAGATVQALRGTYLGLLDVNNDASVIDHTTDPQMGIQRDGVHMSFCIGRYAVGLTFAEKLIPADKRVDGYTLPALRTSQVAGEMPEDYLELIELAVDAAYASAEESGNKKYNVAPLEGYTGSPLDTAKTEMEAHTYSFNNVADAAALEKLWEENISQGTSVDVKADVTLTSSYTAPAEGESVDVTATVTFTHGYHMTPATASIKAVVTANTKKVKLNVSSESGGYTHSKPEVEIKAGSSVNITAAPDYGYSVGDYKVNGTIISTESGDKIAVKADYGCYISDYKINGESIGAVDNYVIENITEDTKIEVILDPILPFIDVPYTRWFHSDVLFVYTHGLMNGVDEDSFRPYTAMNRAMLVTVLWRMEGSPAPTGKTPFTDLKQAWYKDAVAWAYENEIVKGMTETTFEPTGEVIREQMAAIFYRYAQYKGLDITEKADISTFPDAGRVRDYAKDAISWANAAGLITGKKEGEKILLAPRVSANRAEVATILNRFCEKY